MKFDAKVAPSAATMVEATTNGLVVLNDVRLGEFRRESFSPDAFHPPSAGEIPLVYGHEGERTVGRVVARTVANGWHVWTCELDESKPFAGAARAALQVGRGVSIEFVPGEHDEALRQVFRSMFRHTSVTAMHLAILPAGSKPAFAGAGVTKVYDREPSSPAAGGSSDRAAVGDDFDYRPPIWDKLERIVGYRITDENQERAFVDAHRSQLDKVSAEHMTREPAAEPRVIVRYFDNAVIAVR